jgi:hypothetical protein
MARSTSGIRVRYLEVSRLSEIDLHPIQRVTIRGKAPIVIPVTARKVTRCCAQRRSDPVGGAELAKLNCGSPQDVHQRRLCGSDVNPRRCTVASAFVAGDGGVGNDALGGDDGGGQGGRQDGGGGPGGGWGGGGAGDGPAEDSSGDDQEHGRTLTHEEVGPTLNCCRSCPVPAA